MFNNKHNEVYVNEQVCLFTWKLFSKGFPCSFSNSSQKTNKYSVRAVQAKAVFAFCLNTKTNLLVISDV